MKERLHKISLLIQFLQETLLDALSTILSIIVVVFNPRAIDISCNVKQTDKGHEGPRIVRMVRCTKETSRPNYSWYIKQFFVSRWSELKNNKLYFLAMFTVAAILSDIIKPATFPRTFALNFAVVVSFDFGRFIYKKIRDRKVA